VLLNPISSVKSLSVRGAVEKQLMPPLNVANMNSSWPVPHLKPNKTVSRHGMSRGMSRRLTSCRLAGNAASARVPCGTCDEEHSPRCSRTPARGRSTRIIISCARRLAFFGSLKPQILQTSKLPSLRPRTRLGTEAKSMPLEAAVGLWLWKHMEVTDAPG
jgi:hypothetical protein